MRARLLNGGYYIPHGISGQPEKMDDGVMIFTNVNAVHPEFRMNRVRLLIPAPPPKGISPHSPFPQKSVFPEWGMGGL